MHANLAPGERLLPGAEAALRQLLARPEVEAVLVPLVPEGEGVLARAARRYLRAWDARFVHPQNLFAPAARVVTHAPLPGPRNGDAAPFLRDVLARGGRIEALPVEGVATRIAEDLARWTGHFRAEGEAWGALAARDRELRRLLPVTTRAGWWRHNVLQCGRRTIEELEAVRSPAPLPWILHLTREAAFGAGCMAPQ